MNRKSDQAGFYVHERCLCGATFEIQDDGWYQGREVNERITGDPMALIELRDWRTSHFCTARPEVAR